jgi:hypothetical protein
LYWGIESARAICAEVRIVDMQMGKEQVIYTPLPRQRTCFQPGRVVDLKLYFSHPEPKVGRELTVTLQPQLEPLPEPTRSSCTICEELQ